MTQGIFLHGSRPKSKKEIKEVVDAVYGGLSSLDDGHQHDLYCVAIEATSAFGNEFDGSLAKASSDQRFGPFTFVGPDPHKSRKFYGQILFKTNRWIVK